MKIGDRIKSLRLSNNMSQEMLGELIGVSKQTIYKYETGIIDNIPIEKIEKLANAFDLSPSILMNWVDDIKKRVPLLGSIVAGYPVFSEENIEGYYSVEPGVSADFCLRVKGDSMIDDGIYSGDIAFIRKQPTVENGEIAAVFINDEATLKHVHITKDKILLLPANSSYNPILVSEYDSVTICGKLTAVLRVYKDNV